MAIDFSLSDSQKQLQAEARQFAAEVLKPVREVVRRHQDPLERFSALQPFFAEMVKAGFLKSLFPQAIGGTQRSTLELAIATEELAAVDVNIPTALLVCGLGLQSVIHFGTEQQQRRFLKPYVEDEEGKLLAAFAFTEVTGGANFDTEDPSAGVQTFARREGEEWVINGKKHYTCNGTGWDGRGAYTYMVVCRTDPSAPPSESLAHIVVPGDAGGIEIVEIYEQMGQRGILSPRIHFHDVRVPIDNMIGTPGQGVDLTSRAFSWTAALIGAACTGVMRAAFDYALEFTKSDHRSGPVPVIEYQNAGYMLADMKMRIEASRYLSWKACHYLDETGGGGEETAIIAKTYCSELCVQVVYDAMRLVGIDSYTDKTPLEELMRDALCFPLYDGGNMGVRRRQLHEMFKRGGYDPMAAAENRMPPWITPPE